MLQEDAVGWDLKTVIHPTPVIVQIYVWFMLITVIVGFVKLFRLWGSAPPFRLLQLKDRSRYIRVLQTVEASLKQWMGCTFLVSAIVACVSATRMSERLTEARSSVVAILISLREISVAVDLGLIVVLVLFFIRWHALKRIEFLNQA